MAIWRLKFYICSLRLRDKPQTVRRCFYDMKIKWGIGKEAHQVVSQAAERTNLIHKQDNLNAERNIVSVTLSPLFDVLFDEVLFFFHWSFSCLYSRRSDYARVIILYYSTIIYLSFPFLSDGLTTTFFFMKRW